MSLRARLASLLAASDFSLALIAPVSAQAEVEAPSPLSVPPLDINTCPADYPVKGNKAGRVASRPVDPIYHVPGAATATLRTRRSASRRPPRLRPPGIAHRCARARVASTAACGSGDGEDGK